MAHSKLSHSRAFLVRAYPLQTQEMLFDAHWHAFRLFGGVPGRGTPRELYEKPDNVFVAQFIGSPKMNVMACTDTQGFAKTPALKAGAIQLGIRPEHIGIVQAGEGHCDGVVQVSEYLGADFFHYVDCGPLGLLTVRTSGAMHDIEGQTVGLSFEPGNLHFFGSDGSAVYD